MNDVTKRIRNYSRRQPITDKRFKFSNDLLARALWMTGLSVIHGALMQWPLMQWILKLAARFWLLASRVKYY